MVNAELIKTMAPATATISVPLVAPGREFACMDALEDWVVDWMRARGFDFVDVGYAEAKNLGVNLVALGNGRVLSMKGAEKLNADMRARGFEVFEPDMSMFTLGGGGVHCLCQALRREAA